MSDLLVLFPHIGIHKAVYDRIHAGVKPSDETGKHVIFGIRNVWNKIHDHTRKEKNHKSRTYCHTDSKQSLINFLNSKKIKKT